MWRQVQYLFVPRTKVRSMAMLGAIMSFPSFSRDKTLFERTLALECLGGQCRKTTGTNISEDILQTSVPKPNGPTGSTGPTGFTVPAGLTGLHYGPWGFSFHGVSVQEDMILERDEKVQTSQFLTQDWNTNEPT